MTTLKPRPPYTAEELKTLYPDGLELQLVQVLHRHGERSPVSARFVNAGLPPHWPYCNAARTFRSVVLSPATEQGSAGWDSLQWRRRLEKFGSDDGPVIATGPAGELDGVCQHGELTDRGRETTYALGQRLRHLYVDQLKFMPSILASADSIYLRSTPMPRALESVQQSFWGMYPLSARTASFPTPTIVTRTFADETLFPNEANCRRFAQLARAFADRAAKRWNDSPEMQYVNSKLTKWMPEDSKTVRIDSHPRLAGIMDTVNATLAHGSATMLPDEFYDEKVQWAINTLTVEEWYAGYGESREYRALGIGGLMGDVVEKMMESVEGRAAKSKSAGLGVSGSAVSTPSAEPIKFALSGCHDTTMAAILSSLGAFGSNKWPPFTSHVAIEMFHKKDAGTASAPAAPEQTQRQQPGWAASLRGLPPSPPPSPSLAGPSSSSAATTTIGRQPYVSLSASQKSSLQNHYVRIRYNDTPVTIPACRQPGNHLEGDESFCTLETFKRVVDSYTPQSWKGQCGTNLGGEMAGLGTKPVEVAGYVEEGF